MFLRFLFSLSALFKLKPQIIHTAVNRPTTTYSLSSLQNKLTLFGTRVNFIYMKFFTDQCCVIMSSSRRAYALPSDCIADTTRRLCYGKIRRENTALLRTIEGLNQEEEISKRRHRDEKSNLRQIIHHLNYQREGKGENLNITVQYN